MALNFNKIKDLFVVPEEEYGTNTDVTEKKEVTESQKHTSPVPPVSPIQKQTSQANIGKGKVNGKIFESLTQAIAKANLPGEDYLEFMEALLAMEDLPVDDKLKIQTALPTLSTKGLTIQKIEESASYYLEVLNNEKTKFYEALKMQTEGQIVGKQQEIALIEKEMETKAEQIKSLTQEINDAKVHADKIRETISGAEDKIKKTEKDFSHTFDLIANQIKKNVAKVQELKVKK